MVDLKLDSCGDIAVENGDFALVDGTAETLQRILIYLNTGLTEYFWDATKGVPYYQRVFQKRLSKSELKSIFRVVVENIQGVHEVIEVTIVEYNPNTRHVSLQLDLVLDPNLETTTLVFTGILPSECDTDPLFPYLLGDMVVWFDSQYGVDQSNRAGTGTYALVGSAELRGQTSLDLNNKAILLSNPVGNEQNYISFSDTPFTDDFSAITLGFVFRTDELTNGSEFGLLTFSSWQGDSGGTSVWSFKLKEDGVSSKLIIERDITGSPQTQEFTLPTFENGNHILLLTLDSDTVTVYLDGSNLGTFSFSYYVTRTSGEGVLFASQDDEWSFQSSLNGIFGEFLYYSKVLTANQIDELILWLQAKWNLA